MKVFIATLGTETNTFASLPTGMQTFEETMFFRGDATKHPQTLASEPLHVWRRRTEEHQGEVVESIAAFAQPAGVTVRRVYESLRDELLQDLKAGGPFEMVLINMHGAMVADGYDDCEGDILANARAIVGPDVIIGAELDLHCSITPKMVENADAIITFKEYPHIDAGARAEELFTICRAAAQGEIKPAMAVHDCRMINMWRTPMEPTKGFVQHMQDLEGKDGVLSISFAHGFPWGDVEHASAKIVVISDRNEKAAAITAEALGQKVWDMREAAATEMADIDGALAQATRQPNKPVVFADVADNAGGGAPSDSTFLLRAVLDRQIDNVLSGLYWDPVAVRICEEAGEGASLDLRIGGKCGPTSGDPVDLRVKIQKVLPHARQSFGDNKMSMGTAIWLKAANNLDLVINSVRTQTFNPDAFTSLGIDPGKKDLVIVKSSQHFYAGFEPLASEVIYVATPGAINPDFANIPFEKFTAPYWPRVENPFESQA
jgi:microcystin degradation protein MlrC